MEDTRDQRCQKTLIGRYHQRGSQSMSDIYVIMQCLKPWTGRDSNIRYYDNRWASNIFQDLDAYQKAHPECRVMDLVRYGKVWYDSDAHAHVDRIQIPIWRRSLLGRWRTPNISPPVPNRSMNSKHTIGRYCPNQSRATA